MYVRLAREASLLKVTAEFEPCFVPNQISCPKRKNKLIFYLRARDKPALL